MQHFYFYVIFKSNIKSDRFPGVIQIIKRKYQARQKYILWAESFWEFDQ